MYVVKKLDGHYFIQNDHGKIKELTEEELNRIKENVEEINSDNFAAVYVDEEIDFIEF